jgi:hypothetical protein
MVTAHHCQHGQCLGHRPQYQVLATDIVPTHFLGFRMNIFHRCCGRFMRVVKRVERLACAACGAESTHAIAGFAQCQCCGTLVDDRGE